MFEFFKNIFGVGTDIGIDLGTASVLVYVKDKGIVLREPSVVALDGVTKKVIKVGIEAQEMIGRTPGNIIAIRPLRDGVISDYETTAKMLKYFLDKANASKLFKPRVVVCVPSGVTEVEQRAVIDASLGGIVTSTSIKCAGDKFDEAIIKYVRKKYSVAIGERTAEDIKMQIGSVYFREEPVSCTFKGRSLVTGLPETLTITSEETFEALEEPVLQICDAIHTVLEDTPPELVGDISTRGIILTGGGSLIYGLDQLLQHETGIKTEVAADAISCVAAGTGVSLNDIEYYDNMYNSRDRKNIVQI